MDLIKAILVIFFGLCLGIVFPPFLLIVPFYFSAKANKENKKFDECFNNVLYNPTDESVLAFMQKIKGIKNHPDEWNRYRGLWNVVNRSSDVTTPTKEKFLALLMGYGLNMNNINVIDNYKA